MKILRQLGIILGLSYCGHFLATALAIPLPASVIGLLLLLFGLRVRLFQEKWITDATHFLNVNMAFFFLPSAVEILDNVGHIHSVMAKLLVICLASTVITFAVTYVSACALRKITGGKDLS